MKVAQVLAADGQADGIAYVYRDFFCQSLAVRAEELAANSRLELGLDRRIPRWRPDGWRPGCFYDVTQSSSVFEQRGLDCGSDAASNSYRRGCSGARAGP